jgi:hypothetical protein
MRKHLNTDKCECRRATLLPGNRPPSAEECPGISVPLKPDAGNLRVRFDEGEGRRRSLALEPLIPWLPSLLYWFIFPFRMKEIRRQIQALITPELDIVVETGDSWLNSQKLHLPAGLRNFFQM